MDVFSREQRSKVMRSVRSKDTRPEMTVRRSVWGLGYRYRLHGRNLPGRPDLVFRADRRVIFVHGCYWHQHSCPAATMPTSHVRYWTAKLTRNAERDRRNIRALRAAGWKVLVIWECEIHNTAKLNRKLRRFLG